MDTRICWGFGGLITGILISLLTMIATQTEHNCGKAVEEAVQAALKEATENQAKKERDIQAEITRVRAEGEAVVVRAETEARLIECDLKKAEIETKLIEALEAKELAGQRPAPSHGEIMQQAIINCLRSHIIAPSTTQIMRETGCKVGDIRRMCRRGQLRRIYWGGGWVRYEIL